MFVWDFMMTSVMGEIMDWFYAQAVGFFGNFFSAMGNMGADLFGIEAVQSVVVFFRYLGWTLFVVGLVVAVFETGVESQSGRGNFRDAGLNAVKGFLAASLFSVLPVELYKLSTSLQGSLVAGVTGYGDIQGLAQGVLDGVEGFSFGFLTYNPVTLLFVVVLMGCAVIKVFFGNLKRGGILLIQIAVGSLYMFSVPRGYMDGLIQWIKQVIGLCLTAFLQAVMLTVGLLIVPRHPLLGIGLMLAAGEAPRVAGAFGMETGTRANIMSAVYTAQAAVSMGRTITQAAAK